MKRINKILAECGIASRREAEKLILAGHVSFDGNIITDLAFKTDQYHKIRYLNQKISIKKPRLWLFNKPVGYVVSHNPEGSNPIIYDLLNHVDEQVISVGRLDKNTSGLLLLTNNGELARKLELPSNRFKRRYIIRIFGKINFLELQQDLVNGMTIAGFEYQPIFSSLLKSSSNNHLIELTLTEGKNREIRNIMAYYGYKVSSLARSEYGPFKLGDLKTGYLREVFDYQKLIRDDII